MQITIILLTVFNYAKGNSNIKIFEREIDTEDIVRSFIVITTAIMLCSIAIILLACYEPFSLIAIVFEVCSAFGTTGLSMGITPELSVFGKSVIIFMMFVGRIGIFSFLFLMRGKHTKDLCHYPKEKMIIS